MIRIRRVAVIRGVTCIAAVIHNCIVAIRVTRLADCRDVGSGQRKLRRAMIERSWLPGSGRVARLTCLAETSRHVIWIRRPLEIAGVALITICVCELIVVVRMTGHTWCGTMSTCECKFRSVVVKRGGFPRCCRVTCLARLAEAARDMIRIFCSLEISRVALVAIRIHELIVVVRVARRTRCGNMNAGQDEPGRTMVERGRSPCSCCMTTLAQLADISCDVIRVFRSLKIGSVTLVATGIHELIVAICMARLTSDCDVHPGQGKLRRAVIEGCRLPPYG